jgi:hypothetical protein
MEGVSVGASARFAFDTDAATVFKDHEVDLCAVMRGPVVGLVGRSALRDFFTRSLSNAPTLG